MSKIAKSISISFMVFSFFVFDLPIAFAQQQSPQAITPKSAPQINPIKPAGSIPPAGPITIHDDPRIEEFVVEPAASALGGNVNFRWRVTPGPGGSPIRNISINIGARPEHTSNSPSGNFTFNIHPSMSPHSYSCSLTAVNHIGRSSHRNVNFDVKTMESIKSDFIFLFFQMEPREVREGQVVDFNFAFNNWSDVTLSDVKMRLTQSNDSSASSRAVILKDLVHQTIRPGRNDIRFMVNSLNAENGRFLHLSFKYRDQEFYKAGLPPFTINTYKYFSLEH